MLVSVVVAFALTAIVYFVDQQPPVPVESVAVSLVYITQCDELLGTVIHFSDGKNGALSAVNSEVVTRVINEVASNVPPEKREWLAMPPPYGGCPGRT